ncbi:MAG: GAF domain-containing protein, partial [Candidatus Accumulibacter sp.]|nr:GAF domain-containing protein [Accumulibacter sp.]
MHEHPIHRAADSPPPNGYCRTHELNILLLAAFYAVSRVLSRSLAFKETQRDVLRILHDEAGLTCGMISVVDSRSGHLKAHAVHPPADVDELQHVQYRPGEGILGMLLEKPRTVMLGRVADEPRFLNRLGIYQRDLPFIAVPIRVGGTLQGVL